MSGPNCPSAATMSNSGSCVCWGSNSSAGSCLPSSNFEVIDDEFTLEEQQNKNRPYYFDYFSNDQTSKN